MLCVIKMELFYIPGKEKGICVLNKSPGIVTKKGSKGKHENLDFIVSGKIEGIGNITMSWIDRDIQNGNKSKYGKSCVLIVENYQQIEIKKSDPEDRCWFCKGNFNPGKNGNNKNYNPENPIVITNGSGKNRQNTNKVEYKNKKFSLQVGNSISSEKSSGASTILRVFLN